MIPTQFDYYAASSLNEALGLLKQHGDRAKILAGGHSLIPLMKLRLAAPEVIVDIGRIPQLKQITHDNGIVTIGALCTHAQVASSPIVQELLPVLSAAAGQIGDPQVRNRGTIGGNLAHADPAADLPAVVLALEAEIVATGPGGERTIPSTQFFQGMLTTALQPDEILTQVRIPALGAKTGSAYAKLENPASRYAVVGVAAVVSVDNGTCTGARIGITGASSVPVRASSAEAALVGKQLDDDTINAAAERAREAIDAIGDLHASAEYRSAMVTVYARRALRAAVAAAK